jgi:hypothetical protein
MPDSTDTRLARIEEKITAHNTLCDDRWKRIERLHAAIVAFMSALTVGLIVAAVVHFWK